MRVTRAPVTSCASETEFGSSDATDDLAKRMWGCGAVGVEGEVAGRTAWVWEREWDRGCGGGWEAEHGSAGEAARA